LQRAVQRNNLIIRSVPSGHASHVTVNAKDKMTPGARKSERTPCPFGGLPRRERRCRGKGEAKGAKRGAM